jgi:hypothetical protein
MAHRRLDSRRVHRRVTASQRGHLPAHSVLGAGDTQLAAGDQAAAGARKLRARARRARPGMVGGAHLALVYTPHRGATKLIGLVGGPSARQVESDSEELSSKDGR